MEILIFAETDDKGSLKKDAYEIASYASKISTENTLLDNICFRCIHSFNFLFKFSSLSFN